MRSGELLHFELLKAQQQAADCASRLYLTEVIQIRAGCGVWCMLGYLTGDNLPQGHRADSGGTLWTPGMRLKSCCGGHLIDFVLKGGCDIKLPLLRFPLPNASAFTQGFDLIGHIGWSRGPPKPTGFRADRSRVGAGSWRFLKKRRARPPLLSSKRAGFHTHALG